MCKESYAIAELICHRSLFASIAGTEALVIAIGASADSFRAISVRTGKTSINGYFLYFIREMSIQKISEFFIWFILHVSK